MKPRRIIYSDDSQGVFEAEGGRVKESLHE